MVKEILPNGTDAPRDVLDEDGDVRSIDDFIELSDDAEDLKQAIEARDTEMGRLAMEDAAIEDADEYRQVEQELGRVICANCNLPGCKGCGRS